MPSRGRLLNNVAAALFLLSAGCGKNRQAPAGDGPCVEGTVVCTSERGGFACRGGKKTPIGCFGPNGCNANACDQSIGDVDEECVPQSVTTICAMDRKRKLACDPRSGRLVGDLNCDGPLGCEPGAPLAKGVRYGCDRRVSRVDERCNVGAAGVDDAGACTARQELLRCDAPLNGKWYVARVCNECSVVEWSRVDGGRPSIGAGDPCRHDRGRVGDICGRDEEGATVCGPNNTILKCVGRELKASETCRAPTSTCFYDFVMTRAVCTNGIP